MTSGQPLDFSALDNIILEELKNAQPTDSKQKICNGVFRKVAAHLGVSEDFNRNSNKLCIHPDVLKRIDKYHKFLTDSENKYDNLITHYYIIQSNDYQEISNIRNLFRDFVKLTEINRDPNGNKRDKILKNTVLNVILAIDGLSGTQNSDVYNYIPNLCIGDEYTKPREAHVVAIRKMYEAFPENLTGTDAAYVILHVLLESYKPFIKDTDVLDKISKCSTEAMDYLIKHATIYSEIVQVTNEDFITMLTEKYASIVNVKEIAHMKVEQFIKRKSMSPKRKHESENKKSKLEKQNLEPENKKIKLEKPETEKPEMEKFDTEFEMDNFEESKSEIENFEEFKPEIENFEESKPEIENFEESKPEIENFEESKPEIENFEESKPEFDDPLFEKFE